MSTWPLISRNKVEDSKVSVPVQRCTESENLVLKKAAQAVCALSSVLYWFES
jgi:histone-lysine N-methyltransferase SETD2